MTRLVDTPAYKALEAHQAKLAHDKVHMRDLFAQDPQRFEKFSMQFEPAELLIDLSKNIITEETRTLLEQLAIDGKLNEHIQAMFNGQKINFVENRAVLHTALRNKSDRRELADRVRSAKKKLTQFRAEILVDGKDVMPDVRQVLEQMYKFADSVRDGAWKGYSGKRITDVVNIGIGGSDLGPVMVVNSLTPYTVGAPRLHFVSNVDGTHLSEALKAVNHETVLFLVASKTFTTQETLTNASSARAWLVKAFGGDEKCVERHFAALSTNLTATGKFGIAPQNVFAFWDWVGGRYSLWSAIGLSIAIAIGPKHFDELLSGAFAVDEHYRTTTDYRKNIPVQLALTGIWYNNFWGAQTHAILPYDQYMSRFSAYMEQLSMESNGKSVDRNGAWVEHQTGEIVWGEPGTNGQHAFYQLIHQGRKLIPCDFLAPAQSHNTGLANDQHTILLANFFAQPEALMKGKTADEVRAELKAAKVPDADIEKLTPHKMFTGNRPTNSFLFKKLTPFVLGTLIALYEHKTHAQGVIWNISSFCQEGVQLGKVLAQVILPELAGDAKVASHDASTNGLINHFKKLR